MHPQMLFDRLTSLADAPGSVAKLRQLIISLGVSGRLVPHASDIPARVCFQDNVSLTPETVNELPLDPRASLPFTTPAGWRWCPLSSLEPRFQNGVSSRGDRGGAPVTVLRLADVEKCRISLKETREIPIDPNQIPKYSLKKGDLLITRVNGSADIVGSFTLIEADLDAIYCDHFIRMRIDHSLAYPPFLALLGRASIVRRQIAGLFITTAGQKTINQGHISSLSIPVPPLPEQKRIVAKVDELMALCDRLEAQQEEREQKHAAVARASLARFAQKPTPANLNFLFHKSYAIDPGDLRKTILSLAVKGKLVRQDPNDESAEHCLSRLKLRNTLVFTDARCGPIQSVPSTWTWTRFEDIALVAGGVTLGRKLAGRRLVSLPYLRVANVKRGEIDLTVLKKVAIADDELERYALRENDLLMTEGGDWDKVGRAAIWEGQIPVCLHQNHVFRARMRSAEIRPAWFERYFNSPAGRSYFESASKQTTNLASINMRQVRACPVPFPPLPEQRRIVAKVDQLMALVDQLEAQLTQSRTVAEKLMEAIVAELTSSKPSEPRPARLIKKGGAPRLSSPESFSTPRGRKSRRSSPTG